MPGRKRYTRADQIRGMTDDQLAKTLLDANDCGLSISFCKELPGCSVLLDEGIIPDEKCLECMKDWLKQPADMGGGEPVPKNVKCVNCNHLQKNGWCEKKVDSPVPDMLRDCQHFWLKTNGDLIRSMSDEELAYWVMCPHGGEDYLHEGGCASDNCMACTLEWLKQPVNEEEKPDGQKH